MKKTRRYLMALAVLFDPAAFFAGPVFWREPGQYQKIQNERWIAVSSKLDSQAKVWTFVGGGHVQAEANKTWAAMRDFKRLAKIKEVFSRVDYDKEQKILGLGIKVLAIEKFLNLKFQEREVPEKKVLSFQVENGFMSSLSGTISVKEVSSFVSEVSLMAYYDKEVEWPNWAFSFVSEVLMQKLASQLRLMIEQGE